MSSCVVGFVMGCGLGGNDLPRDALIVMTLVLVLSNLVSMGWMVTKGVKLRFVWLGIPLYVSIRYYRWCRSEGRSPWKMIAFRFAVYIVWVVFVVIFVTSR